MLHLDAKNSTKTHSNSSFTSLLAFKPRQVLLAQHNPTTTMNASVSQDENNTKITSVTPELKGNLHEIILDYLHRNGFSKSLKRFRSEAKIQTDAWKASSLHLEDIFCKNNACNVGSNKSTSKKPVLGYDEAMENEKVWPANEETTTKKKKKKVIVESDNCVIKDQSEVTDKKIKESSKNLGQTSKDITVDELETQPKKKKTKRDLVSSIDDANNGLKIDDLTKKNKDKKKKNIETVKLEPSTTNEDELVTEVAHKEKKKKRKSSTDEIVTSQPDVTKIDDLTKKNKDKKKNIETVKLELSTTNEDELVTEVAHKEKKKKRKSSTDKIVTSQPDVTKSEKTSSKKRKRASSDENEHENVSTKMTISEESKCQKTEISKEENNIKEEDHAQETSNKQFDGETNGKLRIDGVKSKKKQHNVTAEPNTVNAFQRVKIDEVEFVHDKLQDNSYWAKGGAEIGYGAKAQEVLGQVQGRDFRHEKTKKKRGSYRGGLIDQQSHSIKFNYSDEE